MSDPTQTLKYTSLVITKEDWEAAKAYFNDPKNKDEVKFRRKHPEDAQNANQNLPAHSFIKVDNEIFALANKNAVFGHLLGKGGFGKVKMAQTEQGESFAVKIEGRGARSDDDAESKIMKLLNYLKGETARPVSPRLFGKKTITQKLYTVVKLRKGEALTNHLYFNRNRKQRKNLSYNDTLLIAYQSALAVAYLHKLGIVHADLKPDNLMADLDENQILIESVDYGLSLMLATEEDHVLLNGKMGTPGYMAPEIEQADKSHPGVYSFSSDIYALGKIFLDDLRLSNAPRYGFMTNSLLPLINPEHTKICKLVTKMLNPDRLKRPSIDDVMKVLVENLEFHHKVGERVKLIDDLDVSLADLLDYRDNLQKKQSSLKYKISVPLHLSKVDKRIKQVDKILALINAPYFYTPKELKTNIENIQKEIQASRMSGKSTSKLQNLLQELTDTLDEIIKASKEVTTKAKGT